MEISVEALPDGALPIYDKDPAGLSMVLDEKDCHNKVVNSHRVLIPLCPVTVQRLRAMTDLIERGRQTGYAKAHIVHRQDDGKSLIGVMVYAQAMVAANEN